MDQKDFDDSDKENTRIRYSADKNRVSKKKRNKVKSKMFKKSDPSELLKTVLIRQAISAPNLSPDNRCQFCYFTSKNNVHMKEFSSHYSLKPVILDCPLCSDTLKDLDVLENHFRDSHNIKKVCLNKIMTLIDQTEWLAARANANNSDKQHLESRDKSEQKRTANVSIDLTCSYDPTHFSINKNNDLSPLVERQDSGITEEQPQCKSEGISSTVTYLTSSDATTTATPTSITEIQTFPVAPSYTSNVFSTESMSSINYFLQFPFIFGRYPNNIMQQSLSLVPQTLVMQTQGTPFFCNLCGYMYYYQEDLMQHQQGCFFDQAQLSLLNSQFNSSQSNSTPIFLQTEKIQKTDRYEPREKNEHPKTLASPVDRENHCNKRKSRTPRQRRLKNNYSSSNHMDNNTAAQLQFNGNNMEIETGLLMPMNMGMSMNVSFTATMGNNYPSNPMVMPNPLLSYLKNEETTPNDAEKPSILENIYSSDIGKDFTNIKEKTSELPYVNSTPVTQRNHSNKRKSSTPKKVFVEK